MKKKYIAPDMEIALFETDTDIMDGPEESDNSPWLSINLKDLPNGTIIGEDGYPKY